MAAINMHFGYQSLIDIIVSTESIIDTVQTFMRLDAHVIEVNRSGLSTVSQT